LLPDSRAASRSVRNTQTVGFGQTVAGLIVEIYMINLLYRAPGKPGLMLHEVFEIGVPYAARRFGELACAKSTPRPPTWHARPAIRRNIH